jgi:hypothetical protein
MQLLPSCCRLHPSLQCSRRWLSTPHPHPASTRASAGGQGWGMASTSHAASSQHTNMHDFGLASCMAEHQRDSSSRYSSTCLVQTVSPCCSALCL